MLKALLYIFTSAILTWFILDFSYSYLKNNVSDLPKKRSYHTIPKPSGGGISFITATLISSTFQGVLIPLISFPLGILGFIDDKCNVKVNIRFFFK